MFNKKRKITRLIITVLLIVAILFVGFKITTKAISIRKATKPVTEGIKTVTEYVQDTSKDELVMKLTEQLNEFKKFEAEEIKRQEKIKALQDPTIINTQLEKVGKLITYEGTANYVDKIVDKKFLKSRTLDVQLTYRFGIGMELSRIQVAGFMEDTVIINIPRNGLVLEYIELQGEKVILNEKTSMLAKEFSSDEIKTIIQSGQQTTTQQINSTKEIFIKAEESLKDNLRNLIVKLGYRQVIFQSI